MQAPRRSLRQGDRSPATCRLLALLKTKLTWIPSLSPHLTRFVAPFAGRPCFRFAGSLTIGIVDEKTLEINDKNRGKNRQMDR